MNAANEIAVESFLAGKIKFSAIPEIISQVMDLVGQNDNPGRDDIFETDLEARKISRQIMNNYI